MKLIKLKEILKSPALKDALRYMYKNPSKADLDGNDTGWLDMYDFVSKFQDNEERIELDIGCKCDSSPGETMVMCCNICGLPTEHFWLGKEEQDLYYIQNKERGYLGNSMIWWGRPSGYTPDLNKAKVFTKEEMLKILENNYQNKFVAYPKKVIDANSQAQQRCIDMQYIDGSKAFVFTNKKKS